MLALRRDGSGAYADENDDAGNKSKGVGGYAKQGQPILNYRQQDNSEDRSNHRPDSALQASAAQDDGREHVELPPDQRVGHNLFHAVCLDQSRDPGR